MTAEERGEELGYCRGTQGARCSREPKRPHRSRVFCAYLVPELTLLSLSESEYRRTVRLTYGDLWAEMGIPAGGLDTGAEGIKSMEQRKVFGGLGTCI